YHQNRWLERYMSNGNMFKKVYFWSVPVVSTTQTLATWMILLVTCDRFIHVCRPLQANRICTVKNIRRVTIVVMVLAVAYNIPVWHSRVSKEFRYSDGYKITYSSILNAIFRYVGPELAVFVLNILLINDVRKSPAMDINKKKEKEEKRITFTLILIATFFLILVTPCTVAQFIASKLIVASKETKFIFVQFANFLLLCNSSVNFIIYCLTGARFRKVFLSTLRCANRHHNVSHSTSGSTQHTVLKTSTKL
ncbi:unnamed protein product, partial [Owenia fusiformis]